MIATTANAMAETNTKLVNSSTNLVLNVQQAETITGIITDNGEPLSGVTIQVKKQLHHHHIK